VFLMGLRAFCWVWVCRGSTSGSPAPILRMGLHTDTDRRRAQLDGAVAEAFAKAKGLHGSPRLIADLRDLGWEVSENTVADSMRRQGLVARRIKRRIG
jgi:putative transposase